jgi:hypothetical protein
MALKLLCQASYTEYLMVQCFRGEEFRILHRRRSPAVIHVNGVQIRALVDG